jgi:perosamine synthetase
VEFERIPIAGPWVTEREIRYVAEAAANDWYRQAGTSAKRFEAAFAEYLGVAHAIAVPHCTSALHLALTTLGIGPGDEVIVPETTWVATAAPLSYVGAVPVFADIDPQTWCLSVDSVERCLTPRTRAVITVDLYGGVPDMARLNALVRPKGIGVIEDAAQSLGAEYQGKRAGSLGDFGVFSFHGTKTLTTGEGGMFVTNDPSWFERANFLRDHGRPRESHRFFHVTELAYKYRMSGLQAAFGLAQLERIDELVGKKRQIFRWYEERLRGVPGLTMNIEPPGTFNTFWMATIVLDAALGFTTRQLMSLFDAEAIETRPFFQPLSILPAFASVPGIDQAKHRNPVAYDLCNRSLNLPCALMLREEHVDRVCSVLKQLLSRGPG